MSDCQTESLNLREEQQVIPGVSAMLEINMERISFHPGNIVDVDVDIENNVDQDY